MGMWVQQVSAWQQIQNWRDKQAASSDQLDQLNSLATSMGSAGADYYAQLANLTANATLKRVKDAAAAKQAEAVAQLAKDDAEQKKADALAERLKVPDYIKVIANKVNVVV